MSSIFKSIAKIALPIAGTLLAPGIGTALGSSLSGAALSGIGGGLGGAFGGGIGGGGFKGALKGAALGGVGGYASGALSAAGQGAGIADDLVTSGAIPDSLAGSLSKSAASGISGGGFSGAISGGLAKGVSTLGRIGGGLTNALTVGRTPGASGAIIDGITRPSLGTIGNVGANLYSGIQGTEAYKDMARAQNSATARALDGYSPYLSSGVSANNRLSSLLGLSGENNEDILNSLRNSPGYQFRLNEGTEALNKSMAARGGLFSGRALKASQELGQGLADQTYNDYVDDLYRQSESGRGAAGAAAGLYQDQGDIGANSILGRNNVRNSSLAGILRGEYGPYVDEGEEVDEYGNPIRRRV